MLPKNSSECSGGRIWVLISRDRRQPQDCPACKGRGCFPSEPVRETPVSESTPEAVRNYLAG